METKYVRVPFEVGLAKKITNGEVDGKIVTRDGRSVRVVCWDLKKRKDPILALIEEDECEIIDTFLNDGRWCEDEERSSDLMLEIPEYMTFKDGDVIAYENVKDVFFIIGSKCSMTDENPHYYVKYEKGYIAFGTEDSFCRLKGSRLVTEEEREKIIDALKENKDHKSYGCLKRFFGIEEKTEHEFKPFDKVLARFSLDSEWCAVVFSHKNEYGQYICCGSAYNQCIPYNEQTAHLLGTTENYE